MSRRLVSVTAYTTLDHVDAVARSHDFEMDSIAVVNATADREDPDCVRLQIELDNVTEEHLPSHADELELTAEQARTLATDLEKYAERVANAKSDRE